MSDLQTALKGASFEGAVTVADAGLCGMITIRGDMDSIGAAAATATGVTAPDTRVIEQSGGKSIAWMSPDELLVLCAYEDVDAIVAKLETALAGSHALVCNVSDARACLQVTGTSILIRETLAKLAPVDMDPDQFEPGEIRRTRFSQVAAAFWLVSETEARVVCFRSVGDYVFNLLKTSAAPGAEVGVF